jgi:RNA polymerase primary sigma factor
MSQKFQDSLDSRSIKKYLEQISKIKTLSPEQEKALGKRIQEGDRDAIQEMVKANLRFVVSYVKKYRGMGLSLLDLINEGNLGLIEAAKRFDPNRNVKFISYAVWWIRQSIIHALTQYSRIYHIPQKLSDQISEMRRIKSQLNKDLGRKATREEVAKRMGIKISDVEDMETLDEKDISLSDRFFNEDMEVGDKISDEISPSVEFQIVKNSIQENIRDLLNELDEKESNVLKLRFGLVDEQIIKLLDRHKLSERDLPLTLQAIGDILNLTRERIRQIEKKAMRKLSRSHSIQQLRGYLN